MIERRCRDHQAGGHIPQIPKSPAAVFAMPYTLQNSHALRHSYEGYPENDLRHVGQRQFEAVE